jgi:hypothetical protein
MSRHPESAVRGLPHDIRERLDRLEKVFSVPRDSDRRGTDDGRIPIVEAYGEESSLAFQAHFGSPRSRSKAQSGFESGSGADSGARADGALDALFDVNDNSHCDNNKDEGANCSVPNLCSLLWGGPIQPTSADSFWTWSTRVFGAVTTAHGINRVFDDNNGVLRRVFWLVVFLGGFGMTWFYCEQAVASYLSKGVVTVLAQEQHDGELPQVTVCGGSPVRCSCEGLYDERVLNRSFAKILPFLCAQHLVFLDGDAAGAPDLVLDPVTGQRVSFTTNEQAGKMVDVEQTLARINAERSAGQLRLTTCGSGAYSTDWFVDRVLSSELRQVDLFLYAGYTDRDLLVRECKLVDHVLGSRTKGQQISCMDDNFWSPVWFDEERGACHTFNPCQGFPIGRSCEAGTKRYQLSRKGLRNDASMLTS